MPRGARRDRHSGTRPGGARSGPRWTPPRAAGGTGRPGTRSRPGIPSPRPVVEWQRLGSPEAIVAFAGIEAFLDAHPDWPERAALVRRAEELMPETYPDRAARDWFARFPPLSGPGRQRLAEMLIAAGEKDAGRRLLREAWVEGDFPRDLERRFLKRHRKALGGEDHDLRLDRLLWEERRGAPRGVCSAMWARGNAGWGEARLRLMERRRGVDWAIRQVPPGPAQPSGPRVRAGALAAARRQ